MPDRDIRRHVAGDDPRTQRPVGDDLELIPPQHEDRRAVIVSHDLRGKANRVVGLAEHGRAVDELLDPDRCHLRERVHHVSGQCQTLPERGRDVAGAGRTAENRERLVAADQVADHGRLVTAHRECRRHACQQRRVAEALTGLQDLDDLLLVDELDRALDDDVQVVRRLAVLDEDVVAEAVATDLDARRQWCRGRPRGARRTAGSAPGTRRRRTRRPGVSRGAEVPAACRQ